MISGLKKISKHIVESVKSDKPFLCESFEDILNQLYKATTEDTIDINKLGPSSQP